MNKLKLSITAAIIAIIAALGISMPAMADTATPNAATTPIPLSETVNAGDSVDLSDIVYTITVAPKTYSDGTEKGVYAGIAVTGGSPITITPATDGRSWSDSLTLSQLFGEATLFPQAGMYEYTIKQTHDGGTSTDTDKWTYDEPEYLLQVLVKTDSDNVSNRIYGGWTLSKWDPTANDGDGDYVKVNSGTPDQDGAAAFSETYKATTTLNVTKQVEGDYASTTYGFEQTITLTLPEWNAKADITATGGTGGTWLPATIPADGATTRTYTVKLKHGEIVTFTNVPVGTRYQVTETTGTDGKAVDAANLKYTPKIDWNVDDGKPTMTVPTTFDGVKASELSALSSALKGGSLTPDDFTDLLGEQVDVSVGDETKKARFVDASSTNGLTFMFESLGKYPINTTYTNAGGWPASDLRKSLNTTEGTNSTSLHDKLQNMTIGGEAITVQEKTTWSVDRNDGNPQVISSPDKFWIPNMVEIFGEWPDRHGYSSTENSAQFEFFKDAGVTHTNYDHLRTLTTLGGWWLRSAESNYQTAFMCVWDGTESSAAFSADAPFSVLPCFCL